jgi:phenylalanyl-tRNA synthetase alpha subunit
VLLPSERAVLWALEGLLTMGNLEPYNFKALGANQVSGALHPLNKMRHEFRLVDCSNKQPFQVMEWGTNVLFLFRQIFFETGFTEMPTNQYIESGFWVCIDQRIFNSWIFLLVSVAYSSWNANTRL